MNELIADGNLQNKMSSFAGNIEQLKAVVIDPEFEKVCPELTGKEKDQLEENILADGEMTAPLIVWNGILLDGHNRRQIILMHPELPFMIKEIQLLNRDSSLEQAFEKADSDNPLPTCLSAAKTDDAPTLDTDDVLGIIHNASLEFQAICEYYLLEFPELLDEKKKQLYEAINSIETFLKQIH